MKSAFSCDVLIVNQPLGSQQMNESARLCDCQFKERKLVYLFLLCCFSM